MGAQEIASITALIQKSRTVIKYLKDVKGAPKECNELMRELRHMEIHLSTVKIITLLSTAGDPWLMILQQLNDPFRELTGLLSGIEKGLKVTSLWWKGVGQRLQWTFAESSAQEDLMKIEDIGSLIMNVIGQHEALAFSLNTKEYKKSKEVTDWLTPLDYSPVHQDKLKQRVAGTGQWFLEAPQFTSWVDGSSKSSTLWCPGDPGTGKTFLACMVVAHLHKRFGEENIPILRVFGDWQNSDAKTVPDIIRSLLKQFIHIQNGLSPSLDSLYEKNIKDETIPSLDEFMDILSIHLQGYRLIYIVFDGFDEFDGNQEHLISALKSFGNRVRLLVTSRNNSAIQRIFQEDEELRIRADGSDIRKLVTSRLDDNKNLRILVRDHDDLRQNILTEKANGMILLADIHTTVLTQVTGDRRKFVEELNELPRTMASMYKHFLERVNHKPETDRDIAIRTFSWVAVAQRPLTILELQYALAVRPGTAELDVILDFDYISSVCVGLVVVDRRGSVGFTYPTTREYFISQKDRLFPGIEEHITRTCLTYMSFDIFRSPDVLSLSKPEICTKYPFLSYASSNWAVHARKCTRGSVEEEILTFLRTQANIALSFERPRDSEPEIPRTAAWFAAHYGLVNVMKVLLDRRVDLRHENVLCIAAHAGQLDMVKLLLSRSKDMDVNQSDKVTYLYDYSIDRNSSSNRLGVRASRPTFCMPLIAAASNGYEDIVRALLESKHMRSLNFFPPGGPAALSAAIFGNHIGVVKLLLSQPGIDTSTQFLDETPLMVAKRRCRDDIVKVFIEQGHGFADDDTGRSPA
ncbi:uncharacterized protein EV420DRAFT_1769798 [Desarmillaria tabescens]|uniref:NACHT domain-containing protein n=1 Tax=Armillaria tabescens TaxID=1929756 RepID=A0AA39JA05_ARMTA|nr:uncharacterized protein EV420DRAFT_1769798 [Desarmillaria tabescens]KAK0438165.1 hypothetical protein EV420DRAFT_1769798 [Desarmillaria tabescens]